MGKIRSSPQTRKELTRTRRVSKNRGLEWAGPNQKGLTALGPGKEHHAGTQTESERVGETRKRTQGRQGWVKGSLQGNKASLGPGWRSAQGGTGTTQTASDLERDAEVFDLSL